MKAKRVILPLVFVVLGLFIAFPIFSMTYYTMVRTSTPEFCASCHEIKPAYEAWRMSTHVNNPQGVVADCMDCHLPAPHDTFNFFYSKTFHGIKDVYSHFTGGAESYDRAEMRELAYESFNNEQCQKCHRNLLYMPQNRGAMLAHRTVLYARGENQRKCVDCHWDLVHVDRAQYNYKQFGAPYRSPGLRNLNN